MHMQFVLSNGDVIDAPNLFPDQLDEIRRVIAAGPGCLALGVGDGTALVNTIHLVCVRPVTR